jgi:pyridinium-3,5-bisthiocarboxylic acid mononucleotide nickel chelatase
MRIAYFELIGGAAGDMIIASLLDAGLPPEDLRRELAKLQLGGYQLRCEHVHKSGLSATQLSVDVKGQHHHEADQHSPRSGPSVDDVVELIAKSGLGESVKQMSLRIFEALAAATAHAESLPTRELRFDPVGVVDSVVDVVGTALGFELLGVQRVYCSPLPIFYGTMVTGHGTLTIPAPATIELIASVGAPEVRTSVQNVQVTPTGAAILTTLATFQRPIMAVERVGHGAGEADLAIPNVVRLSLGNAVQTAAKEMNVSD